MAYLISLVTLAIFLIVLRLRNWPLANGSFNVWVNLPTFDPTAGGDVVERLERDARFNIALGFLLPFLMPAAVKAAGAVFGAVSLEHPQTLIWTVAAWAFLRPRFHAGLRDEPRGEHDRRQAPQGPRRGQGRGLQLV